MFLAVGQVGIAGVFKSDRRDEHNARRAASAVVLGLHVRDRLGQVFGKLGQTFVASERFAVAKEGQNDIGFRMLEMLVGLAKVHRPQAKLWFITREAQVAYMQFEIGKALHQQRFPRWMMLQTLAERVADQANGIVLL